MDDSDASGSDRPSRAGPSAGIAAGLGAVLWLLAPWLQRAVYGTRPYVGTAFDLLSLGGWLLMAVGLVGFHRAFGARYGRLGRLAVGVLGVGMAMVAALLLRSAVVFVAGGFRPVPSTGESPSGLLLTWAFVLGGVLVLAGTGGLGVALRRLADRPFGIAGLVLLSAPAVPLSIVVLDALSVLPLSVGRLAVGTNLTLFPLGAAWIALGVLLRSEAPREDGRRSRAP